MWVCHLKSTGFSITIQNNFQGISKRISQLTDGEKENVDLSVGVWRGTRDILTSYLPTSTDIFLHQSISLHGLDLSLLDEALDSVILIKTRGLSEEERHCGAFIYKQPGCRFRLT